MPTVAVLLLSITLAGCAPKEDAVPSASGEESLVVFLVRHAEKVDLGADAPLSAAGHERAAALARTLRSAEIDHVHSSDFIRTRDTATPTATEYGLQVELYNPRDLHAFAQKLLSTGGRHLVVGHSNTTPKMAELLGGKPGSPINEEGEFDRLYIVAIGNGGSVSSVMLRYGEAYGPGDYP